MSTGGLRNGECCLSVPFELEQACVIHICVHPMPAGAQRAKNRWRRGHILKRAYIGFCLSQIEIHCLVVYSASILYTQPATMMKSMLLALVVASASSFTLTDLPIKERRSLLRSRGRVLGGSSSVDTTNMKGSSGAANKGSSKGSKSKGSKSKAAKGGSSGNGSVGKET
jgi:hypothetical protein